jgi:peptide/nickel transport system ATP-binding protein
MERLPLLRLEGLSVRYGAAWALEGVSLELAAGERLALIGESGSGKSTLAMAVCGLLSPGARMAGEVVFPGYTLAPEPGRDIGVLFQDPFGSLNPVLTVGEQVAEVLVVHRGMGWRAALAQAGRLLDRVRIAGAVARLGDYPHQFSGGQKQRIALAAALAAAPALLVADEPTSALDSVVQAELVSLLDGLVREDGLSLLFITHDIALASHLADRVAVLHAGRLVEQGLAAQVLGAPAHAYTKALLATRLDLETERAARLVEMDEDFRVARPGRRDRG